MNAAASRKDVEGRDLFDVEICMNALQNIADEMGTSMVRTSGNPVIAEVKDFSTFISDADGEIIAFGGFLTVHVGPAREAVRHLVETIPREELHPGDAFICNDPYTTGNAHQPDVGVVRPLFFDDQLVAWCWSEAHMYDVGGMAPGGFAPTATECYAEALRFPGIKLMDRGRLVDDVRRMIEANFRISEMVLNDLRSLIAACNICDDRLQEVIGRYGLERFTRYVDTAKDLAEVAFRDRVATLPDGSWDAVEYVEHNGHANDLYGVHCRFSVADRQLTLDFRGSAPQTDGFINTCRAATVGSALTPLIAALVPDLPINEGTIRAVEILTEPGTICEAQAPAPTSAGHMETGGGVIKVVTRLLSDAQSASSDEFVRSHSMGTWHDCFPGAVFYAPLENGELYPFLDMNGGSAGSGAQTIHDGLDCAGGLTQCQNSLPDIEVNEFQAPILYLWRRIQRQSGGAGKFRGGQGLDYAWTPWGTPGGVEHLFLACWQMPDSGSQGGYPGSCSGFTVVHEAGADAMLRAGVLPATLDELDRPRLAVEAKQFGIPIAPGDVLHMRGGGGGGLGDPIERDVALVVRDVRDGAIDADVAERVYGVVLDDSGAADESATAARRADIRAERLTWDEGVLPDAPDGFGGRPARVRATQASDRLDYLGGWCQPRAGVDLVEYADPDGGGLLRVALRVADDA